MKNKALTSGNYDGFLGMCKNFEFRARKDGGFECTTEIIGQGEIIESLKGTRSNRTKTIKEGEEIERVEVDDFEYWLYALQLWCDSRSSRIGQATDDYVADNPEAVNLYGLLLEFVTEKFSKQIAESGETFNLDVDDYRKAVEDAQNNLYNDLAKGIVGYQESNTAAENKQLVESNLSFGAWSSGEMDLKLDVFLRENSGLQEDFDTVEKFLDEFLIYKGEQFFQDNTNTISGANYVRWDFLVEILNKHVIDRVGDQEGEKNPQTMAKITTRGYPDRSPLLYTKYEFKNVKNQTFKVLNSKNESAQADLTQLMDMSVDPNIALLPHQIQKINNAELLEFTDDSKTKREIGRIFLNIDNLNKVYRGMRYTEDGLNPDFSMFKFLKKIWDSISNSCAGLHKFMLQTEHERPDYVRVIDFGVSNLDIDPSSLHTLKVQSNETIVRDFNFNSTIPNAMSSTIAIAAQNPDSISDLEATSFAALHTNIQTRFFKPSSVVSDSTKENKAKRYDNDLAKFKRNLSSLYEYKLNMMQGNFQEDDAEGDGTETNVISKNKALAIIKALEGNIISLCTRYPKDDEDGNFFKGFRRKVFHQSKSEIIPLKFNAQLDGISGLIIGNVFKIDKTRLPEGYQGDDIAFVVMGENQKITAGQDWVTEISGQIMLLDVANDEGKIDEIDFGEVVFEENITGGRNTEGDSAGFNPDGDQSQIVPGILELNDGDPIYLKIGDGPTFVRDGTDENNWTNGTMVNNEVEGLIFTSNSDNAIGCFPGGGQYDQSKIDKIVNSSFNSNPQLSEDIRSAAIPTDVATLLPDPPVGKQFDEVHLQGIGLTKAKEDERERASFESNNFRLTVNNGEDSLLYLTEELKDTNGLTLIPLDDTPARKASYNVLVRIMQNSGIPKEFVKPGQPVRVFRQSYKNMLLGYKLAERVEVRFQNDPNRRYETLWFKILFTNQAYNIASACPWVIGDATPAVFYRYTQPNDHIRRRHGKKEPVDGNGNRYALTDDNGNETDGAYINLIDIEVGADDYVAPDDPKFGTPIVNKPIEISSIDRNGADKAPYFELDDGEFKVSNKVSSTWYNTADIADGGVGWMEVSTLTTAPDGEIFNRDLAQKDNLVFSPGFVPTKETTIAELIAAGGATAIQVIQNIAGGFGGENWSYDQYSSIRDEDNRPPLSPYYPWWVSKSYDPTDLVPGTDRAYPHWAFYQPADKGGVGANNTDTPDGHVAFFLQSIVSAASRGNNKCLTFIKFAVLRVLDGLPQATLGGNRGHGTVFPSFQGNTYKERDGKGFNIFGEEIATNRAQFKEFWKSKGGDESLVSAGESNLGSDPALLNIVGGLNAFNTTKYENMTLVQVHLWNALAYYIAQDANDTGLVEGGRINDTEYIHTNATLASRLIFPPRTASGFKGNRPGSYDTVRAKTADELNAN